MELFFFLALLGGIYSVKLDVLEIKKRLNIKDK